MSVEFRRLSSFGSTDMDVRRTRWRMIDGEHSYFAANTDR